MDWVENVEDSGEGEGIRRKDDWWEYVPIAEGKVVVEARDLAGNVVKVESRSW